MLLRCQILCLPDPLALELEQALLAGKTNVEASLGCRAAQSCALTSGHEDYRNLILGDQLEAAVVPLVEVILRRVEDGRCGILGERLKLVGFGRVGLGWMEGTLGDFVDVVGVEVAQLLVESSFVRCGQLVVEGLRDYD